MITLTDSIVALATIVPDRLDAVKDFYTAVKDLIPAPDQIVIEQTFHNITDPPSEPDL